MNTAKRSREHRQRWLLATKRVKINRGTVGLIFSKGDYVRRIEAGRHRLKLSEIVKVYNLADRFTPQGDLNLYLADEKLKNMLHVIEVKDNEIALRFENGIFKGVLTSGRHAFWKGLIEHYFQIVNLEDTVIGKDISLSIIHKPEVMRYVRTYVVESHETGLLFMNGKFQSRLEKGTYYFWRNAQTVQVLKTDMRQVQLEISGQEILTNDKAAVRINFYTQYKIYDVEKALIENKSFEKQLYILLQLALREYIGTLSLDELLEKKEAIKSYVLHSIEDRVKKLGVNITDAGIRDIILPGDVKEIMNQVLVAQKKAQANTIMRREETASTRTLLNTAKLMEENDMLYKLKEMEYMEKIADRIGEITVSGSGQVLDQLKQIFSGK